MRLLALELGDVRRLSFCGLLRSSEGEIVPDLARDPFTDSHSVPGGDDVHDLPFLFGELENIGEILSWAYVVERNLTKEVEAQEFQMGRCDF